MFSSLVSVLLRWNVSLCFWATVSALVCLVCSSTFVRIIYDMIWYDNWVKSIASCLYGSVFESFSRPTNYTRVVLDTFVDGLCSRAPVHTARPSWLPCSRASKASSVNTARQHQFHGPCWRLINTAHKDGRVREPCWEKALHDNAFSTRPVDQRGLCSRRLSALPVNAGRHWW